jgi:hypothetical protein
MELGQLQLAKYLLETGKDHISRNVPMSYGLAISLAQDAVEIFAWTVIKEKNIPVKDKETFVGLIERIQNATGIQFPFGARIFELNAIRVKFKHFGNLPIPEDAAKLVTYAEECLREATKLFFSCDFDSISFADLITHSTVRDRLKEAEKYLSERKFMECIGKCGEADLLISQPLEHLLPKVDHFNLRGVSKLFGQDKAHAAKGVFDYIAKYMDALRAVGVAGLLNIGGRHYFRYRNLLPIVYQTTDSAVHVNHRRGSYSEEDARFCLKYVTEYGLKVQQWLETK